MKGLIKRADDRITLFLSPIDILAYLTCQGNYISDVLYPLTFFDTKAAQNIKALKRNGFLYGFYISSNAFILPS